MSSHSAAVRLAPIIKTNAQQARELEMNMLNPLTEDAIDDIHLDSAAVATGSPRLTRRPSSPSIGARPSLQPQSNSAVQLYMFPSSVIEEHNRSVNQSFNQSNNHAVYQPPMLGPAPPLEGPIRSTEGLLSSPSHLNHTSSESATQSTNQSNAWNPRVTSSTALINHEISQPLNQPVNQSPAKRRFPFSRSHDPKTAGRMVDPQSIDTRKRMVASSRAQSVNQRKRLNARHNRINQSCCEDLITFHPFRLSFRLTLVLLCILQVVASAGCVWIISFVSTQTLITSLSSQLRQTALKEIAGEIHDAMTKPMAAVNQLSWSYSRYRPALDTLETWQNTTGLYADLSMTALNYPAVSGLGCITPRGLFFSSINISAYLGAGASPDQNTQGLTDRYGYAIQDRQDAPTVYYYLPPHMSAPANPNMPIPDFNATSTISDIRSSTPWFTVDTFIPTERPQYLAGVHAKGEFAWSQPYRLARVANASAGIPSQSVIAASKAMMKPNGDVSFVCFCTVFMNRLGDLLRSLEVAYGRNGLALILNPYGRLLASSDTAMANMSTNAGDPPIWKTNDARLCAIAQVLRDKDMFVSNTTVLPVSPTGGFVGGGIFAATEPAFAAVPLTLDGAPYHLQATVLNSTGLLWTIVVVTRDKDFDGDFNYHQLVVGMLTLTVLIIAILVMIFVTHCLNRPLLLVVKYMNAVARMSQNKYEPHPDDPAATEAQTLSRSAEQLRALKEIYGRWQEAANIDFEDSESEVSRSSKSSRNGLDGRVDNSLVPVEEKHAPITKPKSTQCLLSRMVDRSAVCLMREVEDMQFTFQSMLHQLTKSTQAVEDANSAKKVFTRYIFHEVRVPLNACMLGLADLRGSCGRVGDPNIVWTDEQRDVLDIVHEQSQVVGRILNDVLSLHRIEDGALTLQYSCFSIESMVLSTMQSFQPGIAEKQIHYTCQLQTVQSFVFADVDVADLSSMPQIDVVGDAHRLRQVLANYLSNAIKFTSAHGNVHVSLQILPITSRNSISRQANIPFTGVSVASHEGNSLNWPSNAPQEALFRVSVRDTGVGVSEADQTKLFSPYMQVLPALLQSGGGSGLGLSIAKSLVSLHGGQIGYQTPIGEWREEGFKSEFYFEVPLKMCFRSTCSSGTPQSTVHQLEAVSQNGQTEAPLLVEQPVVSPFNEDERNEEDQYIAEIVALQRNSLAVRRSRDLAQGTDNEDEDSNDLVKTNSNSSSLQPPLFNSRPNTSSPDSSMRVLAQQRLHAQLLMQNSSNRLAQSPSLQQSQRRLISLAQLPHGIRPGTDSSAEQSSAESDRSANSSKSASVVLLDRSLPAGSSPLAKWSPGISHNSEFEPGFADSRDESEDPIDAGTAVHLRGGVVDINTPSRTTSLNSSRSDIYITLNNTSKLGTPTTSHIPPKRDAINHVLTHQSAHHSSLASPLVHLSSRAVVSDQAELALKPEFVASSPDINAGSTPINSSSMPTTMPSAPAIERTATLSTSRVLPLNSSTTSPLRVLVAEDSVPNLKLLLLLLRKSNCLAEGVENGQLCVDRFVDWYEQSQCLPADSPRLPLPFDMVLIDGNMPVLDGPDATRLLRKMGVYIPIIAVTGNALVEDQRAFIDAGANEVLSKPIQQRELQRLLNAEKRKIANVVTLAK